MKTRGAFALGVTLSVPWLVGLVAFVAAFAVDIPYWDEWTLTRPLLEISRGEIPVATFWAQHGEQRHFFPKAIATYASYVSHWNVPFNLSLNVLVAAASCLLLLRLVAARREVTARASSVAQQIVIPALVFSIAQYETWLWTWGVCWLFSVTSVLAAIVALDTWVRSARDGWLLAAACCCTIATFSTTNAILSWPALLPMILTGANDRRRKLLFSAAWTGAFLVVAGLYAIGYKPGPGGEFFIHSLRHPLPAVRFITTVLGAPLCRIFIVATLLGALVAAVFAGLTFSIMRRGQEALRIASPWIALGLFTIFFAGSVAVGRMVLGFESSVAPRYLSTSYLLTVAVFGLLATDARWNRYSIPGALAVFALVLLSIPSALQSARITSQVRESGRASLELSRFVEPGSDGALTNLYPFESELRADAVALSTAGIRSFDRPVQFRRGIAAGQILPAVFRDGDSLLVRGWTAEPEGCPAAVFLSRSANPRFFAAGISDESKTIEVDVAGKKTPACGWEVRFSPSHLSDASPVYAWTYLRERRACVLLNGMASMAAAR